MIDKDVVQKNISFALSDYYKEWKPYLLRLLKISRAPSIKRSPLLSLAFQIAMLRNISDIEKTIMEQQKTHGMQKNDRYVFYNQSLRQMFKDISDGLAWRLLDFNRILMRILSQNRSCGFLDTEISKEDEIATGIVAYGHHVLIHDVTNILRVGDLTVLTPSHPEVLEVKGSGKRIWSAEDYKALLRRGGDLSKQAKRVVEVNDAIRSGTIQLAEFRAKLGVLDTPVETYLDSVHYVMEGCQEKGTCGKFVDRIMYIRAIKLENAEKLELPFKLTRDWLHFSSLNTLHLREAQPIRNKVPYSVFPLPNDIVIQLLSGEIILESFLNLIKLKKYLERLGWQVTHKRIDIDKLEEMSRKLRHDTFNGPQLFNTHVDTSIFVLSRDGFHIELPSELIGLVYLDFVKPRIISDAASQIKAITSLSRTEGYWGTAFSNERDIWL